MELVGEHGAWALLAIAVAALLVQTLRLWWRSFWPAWQLRARAERASEGERRAEALLARRGYAILARQASCAWTVLVDGVGTEIELRADLIVERAGRAFVAEVKTGEIAPRIESSATRRQLLEYRCAFDVDGVLLVDVEKERVHEIVFLLGGAQRSVDALAR